MKPKADLRKSRVEFSIVGWGTRGVGALVNLNERFNGHVIRDLVDAAWFEELPSAPVVRPGEE